VVASASTFQRLDLSLNGFSREIDHTAVNQMSLLEFFNVNTNAFTGLVPLLRALSRLTYLSLRANSLTGTLPGVELATLRSLVYLAINRRNAGVGGPLPLEVASMTALTEISFNLNSHSGSLPSEYGLLLGMQSISLDNNALDGTIPTEYGWLTKLTFLYNISFSFFPVEFCFFFFFFLFSFFSF
jgi:Leucine-rich repeat (LRR) protein